MQAVGGDPDAIFGVILGGNIKTQKKDLSKKKANNDEDKCPKCGGKTKGLSDDYFIPGCHCDELTEEGDEAVAGSYWTDEYW